MPSETVGCRWVFDGDDVLFERYDAVNGVLYFELHLVSANKRLDLWVDDNVDDNEHNDMLRDDLVIT